MTKKILFFYLFIIGFFSILLIFKFFNIDIELFWFMCASLFLVLVAYVKPRWVGLMLLVLGLLFHFFLVFMLLVANDSLGSGVPDIVLVYLITTFLIALLGFFLLKIKDEKRIFKITTIFFIIIILFARLFIYTNTCNMIIIDEIRYECEMEWNYIRSVDELRLPSTVNDLSLNGLESAEGLRLPKIKGSLSLDGLVSVEGLYLQNQLNGSLALRGITSAEGLKFPESIGGDLYLNKLTSAKGLELPKSISGDLNLESLTSAKGSKFPESIGGGLNLRSLTSAEGSKFPESIGGGLNLRSLTSAEGSKFPESIGGGLNLLSLTSAEGLELPKSVGGTVYLNPDLPKEERERIKKEYPNLSIVNWGSPSLD
jgi:hypothetical protein